MAFIGWLLTFAVFILIHKTTSLSPGDTLRLSFSPAEVVNLPSKSTTTVHIEASSDKEGLSYVYVDCLDDNVATVVGGGWIQIFPKQCATVKIQINDTRTFFLEKLQKLVVLKSVSNKPYFCFNTTFVLQANSLGNTTLIMYVGTKAHSKPDAISNVVREDYRISVIREHAKINEILHWFLVAMVVISVFCISCKVDASDIVNILKKPSKAFVSLAMMFIFKPLFSFALGTVFTTNRSLRMGVFTLGCCPEGAISLIWTHILGGNLALGILISCGEALLSFGAVPLSMLTLGRIFLGREITIPFEDIAINSAEVLSACAFGLSVRRWAPETVSVKVGRLARIQGTVTLVFLIFVEIFSSKDILSLMGEWQVLACGTLLPGLGGLFGGIVAWACCHDWKCVKSIALAIILQGIDLPWAIMRTNLPLPDAQLAGTVPVIAALFANIALWPPCFLRYMKVGCGSQDDVIIHTSNTTMSMKKKKFREFVINQTLSIEEMQA